MTQNQLYLSLPIDVSFAEQDYIVTNANAEAHAQLVSGGIIGLGAGDFGAGVTILVGEKGAGKSHLGHLWLALNKGHLIDEQLDLTAIKEGSAFLLEDVDSQPFTKERETWFFHLANLIKEKGAKLLLTAVTPPSYWDLSLPDWRSRALSFQLLSLALPDDQTLEVILSKMAADRQLNLAPGLIDYMLQRMERSYEGAAKLWGELDRLSLAEKRPITKPLVREALDALA